MSGNFLENTASIESRVSQFVSDPRAAPSRVEGPHPADELNQFRVLSRTPTSAFGLPSPEHPESSSLPADECFGLEDHQGVSPICPDSHEHDPETPVPPAEPGLGRLPSEHGDLVSQGKNFYREFVLRSDYREWVDQNRPEHLKHDRLSLLANPR